MPSLGSNQGEAGQQEETLKNAEKSLSIALRIGDLRIRRKE